MLMFTLAISCLTTCNWPWFMDLTARIPRQYCSLYHWTLLSPADTFTTECYSRFGPATSFFLIVAQSCPTLFDPMDCSMPSFLVIHHLLEPTQTHVHWVNDAILPSHPLLPPSPLALNRSPYQGLFQWDGSSHQVTKVLELQLQHMPFQWIFRVDFL